MTNVRADVPEKYKWDLRGIYETGEAFDADFARAQKMIADFPKHEKTMSESATGLLAVLADSTELDRLISKLYEYAALNSDVDTSDNTYLALRGKVINLANDAGAASYFVSPSLIRLKKETVQKWYAELPELKNYSRMIETQQRYQPYTLSDECEKLMADLQNGMDSHFDIRTVFANADLKFGKITGEDGKKLELTDTVYVPLMMSENRQVRRNAFRKLYEVYKQYGNTFSALLNGFIKERTTVAKVRGYENSLQAAVFPDEVTAEIYNNLIGTVNKNLPVLFDYYAVKKEALGVSNLHLYDIYTPLISACTKTYNYEEAVNEVLDAVRVFGDEYENTLRRGLCDEKWVDVYPTKGKRGGAYSAGCYDTQPYILLNYTEQLDDVSTLAHEAGHSMHSYFSKAYNTPQNSQYTIFVAEVASTVNELIFSHKKLRESQNDEEKLSVLNQIMETYKGTLFRQTMFAEFEKTIHALSEAGETLTQDLLCEKYLELNQKYFGKDVVCDKQIAYEWMRIPHFYRYFYVYKYATCISAASSIVKKIETQGEAYIGKYISFLKCGGSISPLDSLMVADIDLRQPEVIEDAIADFADTIKQFRALYQKVHS